MSGICGWLTPGDTYPNWIDSMIQCLQCSVSESVVRNTGRHTGLGGSALCNKLQQHAEPGISAVMIGNATFASAPREQALSQFVRELRSSGGDMALRSLSGHFALAVLDESRNEAWLAVDRMGVYSLSYSVVEGKLVFASNGNAVRIHPAARSDIDYQSLYNYLYFHVVPGPATIHKDVKRLPPGQRLRFTPQSTESAPYWQVDFDEDHAADFASLRNEFFEILESGAARATDDVRFGTFLSGGTDSSTVTGFAQKRRDTPIPSFSIGFSAEGYDEMEFARNAAAHFGAEHHAYYIKPQDIVEGMPLIAASYEQPYGNSSAVPTYFCARLAAQNGVDRLLAGDGGDELFGGNERYAKQYVFSLYDRLPQALRGRILDPLTARISPHSGVTPLRKLRRYVEQASVPMPLRMETYNLLHHLGVNQLLDGDFLSSVDVDEPHRLICERYSQVPAKHLVNRMLALDFQFTLADNDLPKVTRMCDRAGIDVEFPLLYDDLVAFSFRLQHRHKLAGTKLRPFFKSALSDVLPQSTINKSKHGFGLPFGIWLRTSAALRDSVSDALQQLRNRGIVRKAFIDRLTDELVSEHASYYGTMVWVLVMLEHWFEHHIDLPGRVEHQVTSL